MNNDFLQKPPPAIEARNLIKNYRQVRAVDNFSFTITKGIIAALVGPDGAGKTSLFRILCNLIDFDSGDVIIDGYNLKTDFDKIKPLLGYMPQNFSLYQDLSVEENLDFYAGLFGLNRQATTAKKQQLYAFSGLGPFAGRRAAALSGGMKQKLALSCSLIHDPLILLLDEPTTGVDPLSRRQFWDILKNLRAGGSTIIVSTPYMDEVESADTAIFVHQGKKLAEGTPESLTGNFDGQVYRVDYLPDSATMQHLNQIAGLTCRRFGSAVHIYINRTASIESYYSELSLSDIPLEKLSPVTPGIEDVFIQMMGR